MKRIIPFLLIVACLFGSTGIFAQMNGDYYVGPTRTNGFGNQEFTDVRAAWDSLMSHGVSGPVRINIDAGTYSYDRYSNLYNGNPFINFSGEVTGTSPTNTISLQGVESDSTAVMFQFDNDYTYQTGFIITHVDHMVFRKMAFRETDASYGILLNINGNATDITVENCHFIHYNTTSNYVYRTSIRSIDDDIDSITIQNNYIRDGSWGIYIEGTTWENLAPGVVIQGNVLEDQAENGIYLRECDAPVIQNNYVKLTDHAGYGIRLYDCHNDILVLNNKVYMNQGTYGIHLHYCRGNEDLGGTEGLIANNFVSMTGTTYARGMWNVNIRNQRFYHNSVNITSTDTGNDALAFYVGTDGSTSADIKIYNNIFANSGGSYAFNKGTSTSISSDNNNMYTSGLFLARWEAVDVNDLFDLQSRGVDSASVSTDPLFLSATDLHTSNFLLHARGADLTSDVSTDYDGEARTAPVDIGADEFTATGTPLAGNYTIGASGYTSFSDAVDDLAEFGISSSVVFTADAGLYEEQFMIPSIVGASPSSTITFQSATGDSMDVVISYSASTDNNYVILLKGADFITFKHLSVTATSPTNSKVILFNGSCDYDSIMNCDIDGDKSGTTVNGLIHSSGHNLNHIYIANNRIAGGRYGVLFDQYNVAYSEGIKIINNHILEQRYYQARSIYLRYHDAPEVTGNYIEHNQDTDQWWGIILYDCRDTLKVIGNSVISGYRDGGIHFNHCVGDDSFRGLVANNFVSMGGPSTCWGIDMFDSDYQNIYNNSVLINGTSTTSGLAFQSRNNSTFIDLKNNIFTNFGGGYAMYIENPINLSGSDYNNLYTTGNNLTYYDGAVRTSLAAHQSAGTLDAYSLNANPSFVSTTDLHTSSSFLDGKGTFLVADDIDGETRDLATPDIGADEFTDVTQPLPADTYTIGTGGDFLTFGAVADTLNTVGIGGPVIFDVLDGNYNEQFKLLDINGANETNTITFQSQSGDSTKVILSFAANLTYNYIVLLQGTDHIIFRDMTFIADNESYANIFLMQGGLENITISNCVINGKGTSNAPVGCSNAILSGLTVENNAISSGSSNIWLRGNANTLSTNTTILNNQLSAAYYENIYLNYHEAPVVSGNQISRTSTSGNYTILFTVCDNAYRITNNIIDNANSQGGIRVYDCESNTSTKGLIANNLIDVGGTYTAHGIYTHSTDFVRVFSNSVRITSTDLTGGLAYYNNGGLDVEVMNNIFSNFGGGYAYYNNTVDAITASDYNDLFSTGNNLGHWAGPRADLVAFQTESGMDDNSLSVNPAFVSDEDMHTTSSYLDSAGVWLSTVSQDIDGEYRDSIFPDIGADEFIPTSFPLSGNYTIGGTDPSYATFTEAVEALNNMGVSGPVVFNVRPNSYEEQISILDISGADATNTITFQAEDGDSSTVELTYTATEFKKYLVELVGTDYITFKHMTFTASNAVYSLNIFFRGGLEGVTITNCVMNGLGSGYDNNNSVLYSADATFTDLIIENNLIAGGRSGVRLFSTATNYSEGVVVSNNEFIGQYYEAIVLKYFKAPVVEHNDITMNVSAPQWGIVLDYCSDNLVVRYNKVMTTTYDGGIYIQNCKGITTKRGLIANNFVDCGGTSTAYGIYTRASDYMRLYNNTVRITSTSSSGGRAFYNNDGSYIDVQNNIFANMGGGYAFYSNSLTAVTNSDYNDLFTTGNYVGNWNGNRASLADFQDESGTDANSISVNPSFVSADDIHTTSFYLDSTGFSLAAVTDDIDGQPRDANYPDIGADEFTATELPLAGVYTIGGSNPDYESFSDAVDELNTLGVLGPVAFNVRNGTYTEQIELFTMPGISATDTIIFQSESGDSSKVFLTFDAQSSLEDYLIKLTGADYITFKGMTLAATNSSYGNVVVLNGSVDNLNLLNNIIITNNNASSSVIYSADGNITNDILIKNNVIIEGGNGIYLDGNNSTYSQNVRIIDNFINNQSGQGIYLINQVAPVVMGNRISTSESYYYGIRMSECDYGMIVAGNSITNDQRTYAGIYIYYCTGSYVSQGIVASNYVGITGNSNGIGIHVNSSEYQNIHYNSVNLSCDAYYESDNKAFYSSGGDYLNIKNNNFTCTKEGYAYYVGTSAAVDSSDYNNLYSAGNLFAYWGGDVADLAALNSASSMDINSMSADPKFISPTSYIPGQVALHQTAQPISYVTTDIEGHDRDATVPDIGAYEFYCTTPNVSVEIVPFCFGDSTTFIDRTTGIAPGSTISWSFDGDFDPETSSDKTLQTVRYLYKEDGEQILIYMVQHFAGCSKFDSITVTVNPKLVLAIDSIGAYCGIDDGQATVSVVEGEGPFTYSWSTGENTATATGLAIGTYTVAVADGNECVTTREVEIPDAMQVTVEAISGANCGKADGEAEVTVTGGQAPYQYVWSNGVLDAVNTIMEPGLHYVNIIDANLCYAQGSVTIGNDGTGPQITLPVITNNGCFGDRKGAIDITISGGATPYDILWSNGARTEDIDSLVAGIYDIVVIDQDTCPAAASFEVSQPPKLNVSTVIENASCASTDGRAVAVVSGGTEPYFYSWSSGGLLQIEENLSADIYSVTVTDSKGCQKLEPVIVNNVGGPTLSIETVTGVTCADTTNGAIDISITGGTPLYTYVWTGPNSFSATIQDVTGLYPGEYKVRASDNAGCVGNISAVIIQDPPAINEICLVTVDSLSGKNLVMWERNIADDVAYFNIYRESSQKNVYQSIQMLPVEDETRFTDSVADPMIRSWKYRLSVVDVCGNESELSIPHKTIHLTMNLGLDNSVNLIWDHYEGFDFSTYRIWRFTSDEGWDKKDEFASSVTSWTDPNAPEEGDLFYVIEVVHPSECTSTELKASTLNTSRSNRQTTTRQKGTGISDLNGELYNLSVFPNPSTDVFNIAMDLETPEDIELKVFDLSGKLVFANNYKAEIGRTNFEIDLSGYANGMYYLNLKTENGLFNRILVKE